MKSFLNKRQIKVYIFLVLVSALIAGNLGCGTPLLTNPRKIVEKEIEAQRHLKSVHVRLDIDMEFTSANMFSAYHAEGSYENPQKTKMTVKEKTGASEIITIGDNVYVKEPGSQNWTRQKVDNPDSGTTPGDVTDYLKYAKDIELVDNRGETYHLKFKVDMNRYSQASSATGVDPSLFKGSDAQMEVWIFTKTYYVKRAVMDFSGDFSTIGAGKADFSIEIQFSEFNEPVSIEAPI